MWVLLFVKVEVSVGKFTEDNIAVTLRFRNENFASISKFVKDNEEVIFLSEGKGFTCITKPSSSIMYNSNSTIWNQRISIYTKLQHSSKLSYDLETTILVILS